ncbi:MAG: cobalamin B12-binding domain-containing protein, partial [Desulfotignum balticum]|nr:cobalamin B12-binding domain-containing protein [Desulfotignum balticum]
MTQETQPYTPKHAIKIVTATSLFDGHDAAINIMRRILQDTGAEVIHIGHNRSVKEVVDAAIEEDAQGIAVSSYQGGHMEYFKYMKDLLDEQGASHVRIFGGGGGVIIPAEMDELHAYGITRIYSPEDGAKMGLQGMINDMMRAMDGPGVDFDQLEFDRLNVDNKLTVARFISAIQEAGANDPDRLKQILAALAPKVESGNIPVIGLTGTGGAGKSSLTDELIIRILRDLPEMTIAVISCDPSRRKTGGALLGDRIRMNAIDNDRVYMRSLATRRSQTELPESLPHAVTVARAAGFDMILVETAGIGQGDSRVVDLVDLSVYVMTAEFGAPSQLEKIDMLDYA